MKTVISEKKERRGLLSSWTLELANWLMTEHDLTRREAFKKAHLTRRLIGLLGEGEVKFRYKKRNGETRVARGTLCHGISEAFDHYEYKRSDGVAFSDALERGVYVYFDLDKGAFRSFAAKNLVRIEGLKD